jgi:hypothetical protein
MKLARKQSYNRLDRGTTLTANHAPVSFINLPEWKDGS